MKVASTVQIYFTISSESLLKRSKNDPVTKCWCLDEKSRQFWGHLSRCKFIYIFIFMNNLQLIIWKLTMSNIPYRSSSGVWTARSAGTPASRRPTPRSSPPSWPRSPAAPGPTPSLSPWTRSPWPQCRWCESYTWFYHVFWQKLFLVSSPMHFQWEVESTVQSSAWEGSWFKRNAWSRFEIGCVCG